MNGLIIDSFAGGGGASTGIERALGRSPDFAINHSPEALAMHAANHPQTVHLTENVWKVDPSALTKGRPVFLLWASPDCRHHSKAKGGAPVSASVRGLADVVILWAKVARPQIIALENVEEFRDWGPLTAAGMPCAARKGTEFGRWVRALESEGYAVDWWQLRACDYGAPTIRKRLFVVARRDGKPIIKPQPTHGDPKSEAVKNGLLKPWRTAAEIIDWSMPCPSIFLSKPEAKAAGLNIIRPLADKTMARIARGFKRYVLDRAEPFIVVANHGGDGFRGQGLDAPFATVCKARDAFGVVAPFVSHAQQGGASRAADAPLHTVCASVKDQNQVVAAFVAQHNGNGVIGRDAAEPLSTVTTSAANQQPVVAFLSAMQNNTARGDVAEPVGTICAAGNHHTVVLPHLTAYYGSSDEPGSAHDEPCRTATAKARFGHVEGAACMPPLADWQADRARIVAAFLRAHGVWDANADGSREFVTVGDGRWIVWDIGMRMLSPRELARAQGFPDSYILAAPYKGKPLTETAQRHKIGNSVPPDVAEAVIRANCIDALTMPAVKRRLAKVATLPRVVVEPGRLLEAAE
jgi:DNA (cytosine-5)-methyltransferase 1